MKQILKIQKKQRRSKRTRSKIKGSINRPRLSVSITEHHIVAQLIDDDAGKTVVYVSTIGKNKELGKNIKSATELGAELAQAASAKGIKEIVFDRGPRRYHGRIKAVAESARAGGLKF